MIKNLYLFSMLILAAISTNAQQTFTTFQNASMVIGQTNFTTNSTAINPTVTRGPSYCAVSSQGMLAVAEQSGNSIKIWNTLPTTSGQASDVQISFPAGTNGIAWSPDGNTLIAAGGSNQISIWNSIPTVNNQPPDVTLTNYSQDPQGVLVSPAGKLLVAERYANRILVWNSIPTVNNTVADYVVGQPDMVTTSSGNAAGKLNSPWGIALSPDGKLLIADESNNRVVVYDSIPSTSGDVASVVIGQTAFGLGGGATTATRMSIPVGVTVTVDGKVAVSEYGNNRVTIWDSIPQSNGEAATTVLGQANFTTSTGFAPSGSPAANNLRTPYAISSDLNGRLFVCGRDMNRVLVFGDLPTDTADLDITLTESSTALCVQSNINYSIKIVNLGQDSAKNVTSTATFPSGYTISSTSASAGTYNTSSGYWDIPFIVSGDSVTLTISGSVNAGLGGQTITSYANIINSSAIDNNLNNNSANISTTILTQTAPAAPIASDTTSCYNQGAVLSATGLGTLSWYATTTSVTALGTGATFTTVPLVSAATYYVEANNGCPSATRTLVNVSVLTQADTTTSTSNNTITANENGATYEWIDCGTGSAVTPAQTNQSFTATANGDYAVIVTVGDCSYTSACVNISTVGINENNFGDDVTLYPNPASSNVTLNFGQALSAGSVSILDMTGKQVYSINNINNQMLNLDINHISNGIYFVKIQNNNEQKIIKLIKR